jgi:hypothetical protein
MLNPPDMNIRKHRQRSDDGNAFLPESAARNGTDDDLAELLAQSHQLAVTSGEDLDEESRDQLTAEELGGPFIETRAEREFGATAREPLDDEYEPSSLPEAVGPLAIASPEEEAEAIEAREEQAEDVDLPDAAGEPGSRLEPDRTQVEAVSRPRR